VTYLREAGWKEEAGKWRGPGVEAEAFPQSRALHHQLTKDLSEALGARGWNVGAYSQRGYAKLVDPEGRLGMFAARGLEEAGAQRWVSGARS